MRWRLCPASALQTRQWDPLVLRQGMAQGTKLRSCEAARKKDRVLLTSPPTVSVSSDRAVMGKLLRKVLCAHVSSNLALNNYGGRHDSGPARHLHRTIRLRGRRGGKGGQRKRRREKERQDGMECVVVLTIVFSTKIGSALAYSCVMALLGVRSPTIGTWCISKMRPLASRF